MPESIFFSCKKAFDEETFTNNFEEMQLLVNFPSPIETFRIEIKGLYCFAKASSKCNSTYSLLDLLCFEASWSILCRIRFESATLTGCFRIICFLLLVSALLVFNNCC